MNTHSQANWAIKLPWAKFVSSFDGKVVRTQCKICKWIEGKDKLLVPNLNSLWKHVGHRKALVAMLGVKVRYHYSLKMNFHVANEKLYFYKGFEIMLNNSWCNSSWQYEKNCAIFLKLHLFKHRHPMIDDIVQKLFVQLNVLNNPMKHWLNGACWEMIYCMCEQNL